MNELGFGLLDVATGINGNVLPVFEHGLQAFERLGANARANVTVVLDGVARLLTLDTSLIGVLVRDTCERRPARSASNATGARQ